MRKCEWCDKIAVSVVIYEGCPHCGGGDCGDTGDVEYVCATHADNAKNSRAKIMSIEEFEQGVAE